MTEVRRERWERRAEWPLTLCALLFLAAYAYPILDLSLSHEERVAANVVTWATWSLFAADYAVRLVLSQSRLAFARSSWLDLATVVLPLLRPLRLLRLIRVLSVLSRRAGTSLRDRVLTYAAGSVVLVLFVGALAELSAERGEPNSNIETFSDALWWAISTITTVGYGDRFPVTPTGRVVAVGLMLAGIALLGVVTAAFASWLVERVTESEESSQAATRHDLAVLATQVQMLREELAQRPRSSDSGGPGLQR